MAYNFDQPGELERMRADYGSKTDESGRSYLELPGQGRSYVSSGQQPPALKNDSGGLLHGRWTWDTSRGEWVQKLSGGKILTYAVAATLTAGAIAAAMGGGAAGAGSLASAGSVGSAPGYVPASVIGTGLGGAGTGAMAAADYLGPRPGGSAAGSALDAARRMAGAGGAGDGGGWQGAVLAALAGLPGLLANKGPSDEEKAQLEQARKLQELQTQRIQYQSPLFQAVSQLAMSRLPTGVQKPLGEM